MTNVAERALGPGGPTLEALEVLLANSFDSILITDATRSGNIIYANAAFRRLTGYSASEVIGQTPRILQGPATDSEVISRLSAALRAGAKFEGRAINYKKDGTPFIMHWRVVPIRISGVLKAWMAIQRSD